MRLLHPRTVHTIVFDMKNEDFEKATVSKRSAVSHAWSEVLKFMATKQPHPKMYIEDEFTLGVYMHYLKSMGENIGCVMNVEHLMKYDDLYEGFVYGRDSYYKLDNYFDDTYLFSDCVSLYFKGANLFPYIYGDKWRRYVPVQNLEEIHRQVSKTLNKDDKKVKKVVDMVDEV